MCVPVRATPNSSPPVTTTYRAHCPRTITDAKGRRRIVRCRSWTCPHCAEILQRQLLYAVTETFKADESLAVRIRARAGESAHGYGHDTLAVWKRIRTRLPGMRYIAVSEPDPDGHLHALVTHTDAELFRLHATAAGSLSVDIEPVRDLEDYLYYITSKRANAAAPRIMHSRDITAPIQQRTRYATRPEEAQDPSGRGEDADGRGEDAAGPGKARQTRTQGPGAPETEGPPETPAEEETAASGQAEPEQGPRTRDPELSRRRRLISLIYAAITAGETVSITITLNPPTPPVPGGVGKPTP